MSTPTPVENRVVAGRYELRRVAGHGGMGVLWAAHDRTLSREVAVKEVRLPADLPPDQRSDLRERALREARAAARVVHPSAVTVYDVVEEEGRPWIVMELLPPRTLADVLADDGPLTPLAAARLGLDLLDALAAAHAAGVVHRDVKPANVLFADGRAVLVDFGIATLDDDPAITASGMLLGSPAFMAPERARGEEPTPASDLWSLGATLFAAVEGQPPFRRDGHLPTLAAVVTQEAPPAEHAGPLRPVLAAMLAREPADRPPAGQARALLLSAATATMIMLEPGAQAPPAAPESPNSVSPPAATQAVAPLAVIAGDPSRRHRRYGALAAAMLAPVAVFALAFGRPLPWQHAAVPAPEPVATSEAPAAPGVSGSASAPARSGPPASRSVVRTARTPLARARTPVVSWGLRAAVPSAQAKDEDEGAGNADGNADGDHSDGGRTGHGDNHGHEQGHGQGHGDGEG